MHINNIEIGRHGRYRTTLWTYAGANGFGRGRMEDLPPAVSNSCAAPM